MAAPTNHWKLGLFVVVGVVLALTTMTFLGAESMKKSQSICHRKLPKFDTVVTPETEDFQVRVVGTWRYRSAREPCQAIVAQEQKVKVNRRTKKSSPPKA